MNEKPNSEIKLTDEELMKIHREVMDNFPSGPGAIWRGFLANILPEPIKHRLVPEDKNPLTALPMLGRQLATALIVDCGDPIYQKIESLTTELVALNFARQIVIMSETELGIIPEQRRLKEDTSAEEKLATRGKILASIFASPHFTPALGRYTLNIMVPEVDELAHPGRNTFKTAMEAITENFKADRKD